MYCPVQLYWRNDEPNPGGYVDDLDLSDTTAVDGRKLIEAAESDWSRPVPQCPEWDLAGLVRHTGGIFAWMAAVVSTGEFVDLRAVDPSPDADTDLGPWYLDNVDRTLGVLRDADPEAKAWTFSRLGDQSVAWWRRRLAVEVAIHRWDAEHAAEIDPSPLDPHVAAAGLEEFIIEFLPGLLAQDAAEKPTGTLHLQPTDSAEEYWLDLDHSGASRPDLMAASTAIRGTGSDLLLWMTNRRPVHVDVQGEGDAFTKWIELKR